MSIFTRLIPACLAAATLTLSAQVSAQLADLPVTASEVAAVAEVAAAAAANRAPASATCNVLVTYKLNNVVRETYLKDFVVEEGVRYVDRFSTTSFRTKEFTATVVKDAGNMLVAIDYFSDIGAFVSVGFDTKLTIKGGGGTESTSGSNSTYISSPAGNGAHTTTHALTCRRT